MNIISLKMPTLRERKSDIPLLVDKFVKFFNNDKGFGFIDTGRNDVFFHHSALVGVQIENLQEGQLVEYDEGRGPKGPRAENVRLV